MSWTDRYVYINSYSARHKSIGVVSKEVISWLIVQCHLVFYNVDENQKQAMIYAVVDARQHYVNLI